MITQSLHGNNRLIQKTIWRMYPSSFAATLTVSIALMMDTLLAGFLLGQQAIAAVAIGLPAVGIFQALTQTVVNGTAVKLAVHAGRSDRRSLNRSFSLGAYSTILLGVFFLAVCVTFADRLTIILGGAGNPAVAAQAALYLRASSVCIVMGSINNLLGKVLALYGYQKDVFRAALIAMLGNIIFSSLFIYLFPDEYAIAGLGIGTWCGGFLAILSSVIAFAQHGIPLRPRLKDVHVKEIPEILRLGIPTSGNNLADGLVSGVINNIIIGGFAGDTTALSVYTAVKGVYSFAITSVLATTTASSPLVGLLYGSRDKNGLLRTVREGCKIGLVTSVIWAGVIVAALPLLSSFYGMEGNPEFRTGFVICLAFLPLWLIMRIFIQMFESTENTTMGLLYSIVPDSVIYPIILTAILPVLGYNGIWIAYAANALPFLLVLYLIRSLKSKTLRLSPERMLCLDETIRDHAPMLDISILSSNSDVTGISGQVHKFLKSENVAPRTSYMTALCIEELAADFVEHTQLDQIKAADKAIMDIKLFSDADKLRIIIRNVAPAYNPLDFQLDTETFSKIGVNLVQKVATHIDYSYVYKMNIITIDLNK